MKIEQTAAQGSPGVKPTATAGKPNPSAAGEAAGEQESAAEDSVELSSQAQKLAKAPAQAQPAQAETQQATLLASAKNLVATNPVKARSQLETIIAQNPNSADAQKARQLLARIPQSAQ